MLRGSPKPLTFSPSPKGRYRLHTSLTAYVSIDLSPPPADNSEGTKIFIFLFLQNCRLGGRAIFIPRNICY
jgi:hypothetical protein